jgi:hypothetical protein
MKNSKLKTSRPPTLTDHISFGKVGKGPNGERFIRIIIQVDEQRHKALLRFDDLMDGSRGALAPLNRLGAHLVSSAAKTEFLRRLQDLGPKAVVQGRHEGRPIRRILRASGPSPEREEQDRRNVVR